MFKRNFNQKEIPDKLYYKIGEVAEITNTEPYVLRYWESEFPSLNPSKNSSGQRLYKKRDIEIIMKIKRLLYIEGFTIAGAKKKLMEASTPSHIPGIDQNDLRKKLEKARDELKSILTILENNDNNLN